MPQFSHHDIQVAINDPTILALDDLRARTVSITADLQRDNGWEDFDLRIAALHRIKNVAQTLLAHLVFQRAIFSSPEFWQAYFESVPTPADFHDHLRESDMLLRFGAIQGTFSALESDVRSFVQSIDPAACREGRAEFASVMDYLLARAPAADGFRPLIALLRHIRNTLHNNGTHRTPNGGDQEVSWKGLTYEFQDGVAVDFIGWPFVVARLDDLLDFILNLVTHDPLVAIPSMR